jgi:hypothetical protein
LVPADFYPLDGTYGLFFENTAGALPFVKGEKQDYNIRIQTSKPGTNPVTEQQKNTHTI